jgi:hypothetical protein
VRDPNNPARNDPAATRIVNSRIFIAPPNKSLSHFDELEV